MEVLVEDVLIEEFLNSVKTIAKICRKHICLVKKIFKHIRKKSKWALFGLATTKLINVLCCVDISIKFNKFYKNDYTE